MPRKFFIVWSKIGLSFLLRLVLLFKAKFWLEVKFWVKGKILGRKQNLVQKLSEILRDRQTFVLGVKFALGG